ncbi:hypothetical protein WPS_08030 [Vulcanimicrobium alpinum]|uniref:HTH araC/xylS-type domain-containing protein n=1 Tax=Vulcanimicrobium alpinum TaxID=3016050 RepID=A0AAN1XWE8_UNVUL|nr:helix-turn-helix transcriptional regulator [Vulcanimicrobium alpinum]BDE05527.1 hypothetical protein WPS_08030 [Vulcanimicrobium alpinum]
MTRIGSLEPGTLGLSTTAFPAATAPDGNAHFVAAQWVCAALRSGRGSITFAGTRYAVDAGTVAWMPPGEVRLAFDETPDVLAVAFVERFRSPLDAWRPFSAPVVRTLDDDAFRRWNRRLDAVAHRLDTGRLDDRDVAGLKRAFLEHFWLRSSPAGRAVLHRAFGELYRSLDAPVRLEEIAARVGYTRNHLSDLFREFTGHPMSAWSLGLRMTRARERLVTTDVPIADVGLAAGYDDAAYFARAFRRYHGVPPHAWRIAHRPADPRYAAVTERKEYARARGVA